MILTLLFLILILSNNLIFSQYSPNDSALVKTTFLRDFNKEILYNYLSSNDSAKVNAALLSISHSEDTTFVDSIIKLNFNTYGKNITFTLGQIGKSKCSEKFLINKLNDSLNIYQNSTFKVIGKVGDSLTLENLFKSIDSKLIRNTNGFPYSITDFYFRGIKNNKSLKYLLNKLNSFKDEDELFQTLFALYRIGPTEDVIPALEKILSFDHDDNILQYVLGIFRKIKYFPNKPLLLSNLVNSNSWRIRTETANGACFYPFNTKGEISNDLYLILDKNPNVSRTAASALKNINFTSDKKWLKSKIEILLNNSKLTQNTKGELLISYASLFKIDISEIIDKYSNTTNPKYIYRLLKNDNSNSKFNFNYLKDRIAQSSEIELLDLLPAYLELQNKYLTNKEYTSYLYAILKSNKTSSVSIIADELELPLIQQNKEVLQELILEQIFNHKNDAQYVETSISLANLANKVDKIFYESIIDMLSTSTLNSIRKYALEKQSLKFTPPKDDKLFKQFWSCAFKYKFAKVETSKGNFTIELKPESAPITCGNFISLAEKGFYDGVIFHRVVPNFVIQTGDTTNTGWGGPGYEIVSEFSPLPFDRAAVGIASIGKDTEGSQWFVMHSISPHLNGRYTNWANVIEGMDVVDIIDEGDRVISIIFTK